MFQDSDGDIFAIEIACKIALVWVTHRKLRDEKTARKTTINDAF